MELPEKIYLYPDDRAGYEYEAEWGDKPWGEDCVEYTRTDVIVERAVTFIKKRLNFADNAWYIEGEITIKDKVIEDFQNYMKGE